MAVVALHVSAVAVVFARVVDSLKTLTYRHTESQRQVCLLTQ